MLERDKLLELYNRLFKAYGPQHWWPAETPFEVMVGAVLTQNTAWINVEKAIYNLKAADKLALLPMIRMSERRLAGLIRPAGYFNIKTRRLKALCQWLKGAGGIVALENLTTEELRTELLSVHGVGPETADDILLYACERPVFVIDAYTRRLLRSLGLCQGDESYERLRNSFESVLEPEVALYNEYHALIVRHAKERCTDGPDCRHCSIESPLP